MGLMIKAFRKHYPEYLMEAAAFFILLFIGLLAALFITFEALFSGWTAFWDYFPASILGMFLFVEAYRLLKKEREVICAKLHHLNSKRCIFKRYGYAFH